MTPLDSNRRDEYPRDGRRKVEVEETAMLSLPLFEDCPGCFARLNAGHVDDSCDCIAELIKRMDTDA